MKTRTNHKLILLIGFLFVAFCSCKAQQNNRDGGLETQHLFEARTGGYHIYRIPGIIATKKGTLIVWAEARKGISDWEEIALVMRRSTDDGQTWSDISVLAESKGTTKENGGSDKESEEEKKGLVIGNGVMIADDRGTIHFLHCQGYEKVFYSKSTDDGLTFTDKKEITDVFDTIKKEYPFRVVATGPGHGIQLKNGRLLVPVWMSTGELPGGHRPSKTTTLVSDDFGKTWKTGEIVLHHKKVHFYDNGQPFAIENPSETSALQLVDGRVMLNARTESPEQRRVITYSPDGISDWSTPTFDVALFDPICMGSVMRLTQKPEADKNRILFVNPDSEDRGLLWGERRRRENLTVRLSYDEGKSWAVFKVLDPQTAGYADIAVGKDHSIYVFYEDGGVDGNAFDVHYLTLAKFNVNWLTDGTDQIDN